MDEELLDYVRANRTLYTREALRERLLAAGHLGEAVDEAIDAAEREGAVGFGPAPGSGTDQRGRASLILVSTATALFLGWVAWAAIIPDSTEGRLPGLIGAIGVGLLVVLAIAVAIGEVLIARDPDLEAGVEGALLGGLLIPVLILFGVLGTCVFGVTR